MKKSYLFIIFIILIITCSCENKAPSTKKEPTSQDGVTYSIRSPKNEEVDHGYWEEIDTLEDAKDYLQNMRQYGYVIYDFNGNLVYHPFDTLRQSELLYYAKLVADYVASNGYTYGNASKNPALDRGKTEKLVSCDRFVGWVLHDLGFVDGQPTTSGLGLYGSKNLENFLKENGFIKITDKSQLKPADIIFVGDSAEHYPNLQGAWLDYPDHVFIYACEGDDGLFYRYDAGSTKRIKSNQPSCEPLEYSPEKLFRFAYRLPQAQ